MKTVKVGKKKYQLKSSFEEFTKNEFLKVAFIRSQYLSEMTVDDNNASRIQFFIILSTVPKSLVEKITADQWVDILPHLDFCFEAPDFKETPVKTYSKRFRKLHAPVGLMDKSSFEEMIAADNVFMKINSKNEVEDYRLLAAILYRPKRKDLIDFQCSESWNGDIREPFNYTRSKQNTSYFNNASLHFLVSVFLYYLSFRDTKLLKFKELFKEGEKSSVTNLGWAGTALSMASTGVFGDFQSTSKENCINVVTAMNQQLEIDVARREKFENQQNQR